MKKIGVWGDSILKGATTTPGSDHLFDIVEDSSLVIASRNLGFELYNDSVFGSILTKTQRRLNRYFEKGNTCDIAILESGGNDCDYDWALVSASNGDYSAIAPKVPLEDFLRIWDEMVNLCLEKGVTPVIMTMPSLVGDRWYDHICINQNKSEIDRFLGENPSDKLYRNHELYNACLVEYCHKKGVKMVDMRKAMLSSPDFRSLMCLDGIHPNEAGYKYMATVWEKELPELL